MGTATVACFPCTLRPGWLGPDYKAYEYAIWEGRRPKPNFLALNSVESEYTSPELYKKVPPPEELAQTCNS